VKSTIGIPSSPRTVSHQIQRRSQRGAGRKRALGGPLDHRAVRDRIGERDADLDDVRTAPNERAQDVPRARVIGIAGSHVGHEAAPAVW
jgi:hypothetical protein